MKKKIIIIVISIILILSLGVILYRTDIVNSINNIRCKNIDGTVHLLNADYVLSFVTNVSGNRDNQEVESEELYIYEESNKIIYKSNNTKKVSLLSLGDQYYRLNKIEKLEDEDVEIIKKTINNNKKKYFNYYKEGDVIITIKQTQSYIDIDKSKADELYSILEKVKK